MVILTIIGISILAWYLNEKHKDYLRKTMPKIKYQLAKDEFEIRSKAFYKTLTPCIFDMKALHEAYENGLHRLNEIELNKFFSYPKEYIINSKDELIVNDVNLGDAKKCSLLQIYEGYTKEYGEIWNYGIRYSLIKEEHDGYMLVEEYRYRDNFTALETPALMKIQIEKGRFNEGVSYGGSKEKEIQRMTKMSEVVFRKYGDVLPQKYKALYDDFQKNDYTSNEMDQKLKNLYKECNEEYDKYMQEKNANYLRNKENKEKRAKERVGEFYEKTSMRDTMYLDVKQEKLDAMDEGNKEKVDFLRNELKHYDEYIHSGFESLDLVEKYRQDEKIIEEYGLE